MENSPVAAATRLDGANVTTVEAGLLSAPQTTPIYTFSIPALQIDNTRSLFQDTDYVSLTLAVGNGAPQTKTLKIGNVGNGSHTVGLSFDGIPVQAGQNVVLTYAVINNGHNSDSEVESALVKAGDALGQAAAKAAASAIGGLVGAELGASIGTAAVPIIGTALGVVAGWLVGELSSIAFADCDGPVAAGVHIFTAAQLAASGGFLAGDDQTPGTASATGCGSNSNYRVSWLVNAGAEVSSLPPGGGPTGGGGPSPDPGGPAHRID